MSSLLLRASVLFALVGMGLGLYMGVSQDLRLAPVHAHINLLGFVALFLAGVYYRLTPEAAALRLAKLHVGVALCGACFFPVALALVTLGDSQEFGPVAGAGGAIVIAGMALFAIVVFRTSGRAPSRSQVFNEQARK